MCGPKRRILELFSCLASNDLIPDHSVWILYVLLADALVPSQSPNTGGTLGKLESLTVIDTRRLLFDWLLTCQCVPPIVCCDDLQPILNLIYILKPSRLISVVSKLFQSAVTSTTWHSWMSRNNCNWLSWWSSFLSRNSNLMRSFVNDYEDRKHNHFLDFESKLLK